MDMKMYDDKTLQVSISDSGIGIADVQKAKEPLFTTDTSGDRSGMGFAIMESFCDRLSIKSTVGKGTKIIISKKLRDT